MPKLIPCRLQTRLSGVIEVVVQLQPKTNEGANAVPFQSITMERSASVFQNKALPTCAACFTGVKYSHVLYACMSQKEMKVINNIDNDK